MEIERKFLISSLPALNEYKGKEITQGYISTDPVIRIRQMQNNYCLCIKSQGHMIREEFELPLTEEQYASLLPKVEHHLVEKTRYFIPLENNLVAELDLYKGHLEGLFTVEVEFSSPQEAARFIAPKWFGNEITHDNRYKNNHLAVYGIPENK
jgi:CYTH domain-containing protein